MKFRHGAKEIIGWKRSVPIPRFYNRGRILTSCSTRFLCPNLREGTLKQSLKQVRFSLSKEFITIFKISRVLREGNLM